VIKAMNRKKLYQKAKEKWGIEAQQNMLIEECAELIQAINKYERLLDSKCLVNLIEEIADVEIMLEQIKQFLCLDSATKSAKLKKLQRLEKILKGD